MRKRLFPAIILALVLARHATAAEGPMEITVSIPGPRSFTFTPIEIIPAIGADRAENARVIIRHASSGSTALQDLLALNSDFASAGLPAAMSHQAKGGTPVIVLAAISDQPLYVLMVRSDLKKEIRSVADLKGRTVGVNASSLTSKTASQQLAEIALKTAGVPLDSVRFVATGQSWEAQSTMLKTRTVDAIMGDEPFASRLLGEGQVFFLLNMADPGQAGSIPGTGFLRAVLVCRSAMLADEPGRAERMVRIVQRALDWMARATAARIADAVGITDPEERRWMIFSLEKYPRSFSRDGRFSVRQLRETDIFFAATSPARPVRAESLIDSRFAGRRD